MLQEKDILILSSEHVTYNFEKGPQSFNHITYAFKERPDDSKFTGLTVLTCNVDASSYAMTCNIKPNEWIKAKIGTKQTKDGSFKYVIREIKGVTV